LTLDFFYASIVDASGFFFLLKFSGFSFTAVFKSVSANAGFSYFWLSGAASAGYYGYVSVDYCSVFYAVWFSPYYSSISVPSSFLALSNALNPSVKAFIN